MLWQFFPVYTIGTLIGLAFVYAVVLFIERLENYNGISKRKKERFVFWGLKILEFSALVFVIEMAISLMTFGTSGGFFHTTMKLAFSVILPLVMLVLIVGIIWLFVMACKGFVFAVKKIRKDIVSDIKRFFSFIAGMWASFVQANRDYAEVIARDGVIHSITQMDMLRFEVGWMRRERLEDARKALQIAEARGKRIRQDEKYYNGLGKPTIKPIWYPLGGKDKDAI